MAYTWKLSTNPCSVCIGLSTQIHLTKPERPHRLCQCTFLRKGGGGGNQCQDNIIEIIALNFVGASADYTVEIPDYTNNHLIHEFEVLGICPDGTSVEVSLTVDVTGQELDTRIKNWHKEISEGKSGDDAVNDLMNYTSSQARDKALEEFKRLCPDCPPFIGA